jgi:prepilin-type N-terminal cleavage/methylation domain-containing protein
MSEPRVGEHGFSLIELMVAMVVTLIVTGAVFGLMAGGQTAFRNDPQRTDRQQNIRVAMDLLQRDLATAGFGLDGPWTQVFRIQDATVTFDGGGPPGAIPLGEIAADNGGGNSDILEFLASDGLCENVQVTDSPGANLETATTIPGCYSDDSPVLVLFGGGAPALVGFGHRIHGQETRLNFPPGLNDPPLSQIGGPSTLDGATGFVRVQVIRYQIGVGADGIPELFRSTLGGMDLSDGAYHDPPSAGWASVARGIDDLQVEYRDGVCPNGNTVAGGQANGVWLGSPPDLAAVGAQAGELYSCLVREVRITLSARTEDENLQGALVDAQGTSALRGRLVSTTVPRSTLFFLSRLPAPPRPPPGQTPEPDQYSGQRWQ